MVTVRQKSSRNNVIMDDQIIRGHKKAVEEGVVIAAVVNSQEGEDKDLTLATLNSSET